MNQLSVWLVVLTRGCSIPELEISQDNVCVCMCFLFAYTCIWPKWLAVVQQLPDSVCQCVIGASTDCSLLSDDHLRACFLVSFCLFEGLWGNAVCILQPQYTCRAGYIISCNVTSHNRLAYHLFILKFLNGLWACHIFHINRIAAVLKVSRKVKWLSGKARCEGDQLYCDRIFC